MRKRRLRSMTDPDYPEFKALCSKSIPLFEQRTEEQQKYALGVDNYYSGLI